MREVLLPEGWKRPSGYANGVVVRGSEMIFLGGQIGWDAQQQFPSLDFVDQVRQALRNVITLLHAADAEPRHIVRMTWYVTSKATYLERIREVGACYREVIGRHFPPMSVVEVAALVENDAQVEIEVTAVR